MRSPVVGVGLVAAVALLPATAPAQDAGARSDARLQMEMTRRRLVVRPDAPGGTAARDVERVVDELAIGRLVEEVVAPTRRPPQLDHDVTSAIQARGLQRARRR